jgi:hypothetical protein
VPITVLVEPDTNECRNGKSDGLGIDQRYIGGDDALFFKKADTPWARTGGKANLVRKVLVRHPPICLQAFEYFQIQVVHRRLWHIIL